MVQDTIHERRRLNDEIEGAFIRSAQAASNVEMKIVSGKGALFPDFIDFHSSLSYLIRLTINLQEMEPKEEPVQLTQLKISIRNWLHKTINNADKDEVLLDHCRKGLDYFDNYYKELMHCGIISLPTRKG
jgi:hypothetical protein